MILPALYIWEQSYGFPKSIALDKNNNVYITGYYIVSTGWYDFLTIKYSYSGAQEWVRRYSIDSTSFSQSVANAITIDYNGNVYVSGYTKAGNTPRKLTTLEYSNTGNLIWVKIDSDSLTSQSTFMDIDKKNNIYLTGSIRKSSQSQTYGIIKYDSSGKEEWRKYEYYGSYPSIIKVDDDFNIYLTGISYIGQKMCTVKLSQIVSININHNTIPVEYKLYQNYPNPFNLSTKIKFDITSNVKMKRTNVKLIILDILGREVVSFVNEQLQPGGYEFEWDAKNYSSGIYFYRLLTESYIETRKMILFK